MVEDFDRKAKAVTAEQVPRRRADLIRSRKTHRVAAGAGGTGVRRAHLHHVGQDLTAFIDAFGEHVLPEITA
jgi:hypothetical protein